MLWNLILLELLKITESNFKSKIKKLCYYIYISSQSNGDLRAIGGVLVV